MSVKSLAVLLSYLRALSQMYEHMHWKTKGDSYYSDHLLFERLYNDTNSELDIVAEKALGVSNDDTIIGPDIDKKLTSKFLTHITSDNITYDDFPNTALDAEKQLLELIKKILTAKISDGVDNMLQGIFDKHESHIYLLRQRTKTAGDTTMYVKLLKLASYAHDKQDYQAEQEIQAAIKSLLERVGLKVDDLVSVADYYDSIGNKEAADKFDTILKKYAHFEELKKDWHAIDKIVRTLDSRVADEQCIVCGTDIDEYETIDFAPETLEQRKEEERTGIIHQVQYFTPILCRVCAQKEIPPVVLNALEEYNYDEMINKIVDSVDFYSEPKFLKPSEIEQIPAPDDESEFEMPIKTKQTPAPEELDDCSDHSLVHLANYYDSIGNKEAADKLDVVLKKIAKKIKYWKGKGQKPPVRHDIKKIPGPWMKEKKEELKKKNPDYSNKRLNSIVTDIWYNTLSDAKRNKIWEELGRKGKAHK